MVPYISETLDKSGLSELKNQFNNIVFWLKEYFANAGIVFLDFGNKLEEETYYDAMNFLTNPRFKVKNEKLNFINMDDRELVSKKYKVEIEKLDGISQKLWGYGTEEDGWKNVLEYIRKS